jgi:hypothetical protein
MTDTMLECKTYAEQMYQKFESNIISMVFAENKNDVEKLKQCQAAEREMINTLLAAPVEKYNCFMTLLIAEYKERTYWSICDAHCDSDYRIECDILSEYTRIFSKNCIWDCMAKSQKHDPTHIMFAGKHYHFYDMLEEKGYNILTMSEEEVYNVL